MSRDCEWLTHDFVDGDGWEERGRGPSRRDDFSGWAPSGNGDGGMEKRSGYGGSNGGGWNGAGGGGNGDDRRSNQPRRNVSSFDSEASTSESESEDGSHAPASGAVEHGSDDDDVPLAQRIPTALKAQRTIRLKAREERDQRRKERAAVRTRQATLRPAGAAAPVPQVLSSSHEAALHASMSVRRPRTQTISGTGARMPFAVEDLALRLQTVQAAPAPLQQGRERMRSVSPDPPVPRQTLRPMRSFHRPERQRIDDHQAVPMPADADQMLRRSNTRAKSRTRADSVSAKPRAFSPPVEEPLPALPVPRRSVDERATTKLVKARTSTEQASVSSPPLILSKGNISQQRIFIGDRQRFNMVEVGPSTNAGQVIEMVEAQGSLKGWVGTGAWMLFEVAQDFGMERPIRSFELLSDVEASWNKDKMVNIFVAKLTPLALILSRSAIPTSSPVHSGWVEWEIKRGKWTKRWLSLREHSLFLSKRERGKDETLLCSLSNFDAYTVIRVHKSPKPYVFAIKSTDNISFFENTADYLHVFSCPKSDGEVWMEKILLARSYVLHQERNVLFNPKASGGNSAGSALSRAPTRKAAPPSHKPRHRLSLT
ncbi:hypothetical protein BDZ89DRAFT_1135014 [Hymenopellis radicata]|nr:hypothetical protein BDZ89DRAFT_1135014 [Hymenopellis radicata]